MLDIKNSDGDFVKSYEPELVNLESDEIYNLNLNFDNTSAVVSTTKDELNEYICRLKRLPKSYFSNGLLQHALKLEQLIIETSKRNDFLSLQKSQKQIWKSYREACIELVVLNKLLLGVRFQIVE